MPISRTGSIVGEGEDWYKATIKRYNKSVE